MQTNNNLATVEEARNLFNRGDMETYLTTLYTPDVVAHLLPVLDADGYPVQERGVPAYPGLYFVGLNWLHSQKSGLLQGVGDDAAYIVSRIVEG